jgi:hypothetical protein
MIRRGFWLAAGAVTGIYGYRRVSAIGRRLSASLNPSGPAQGAALAGRARRAPHGRDERDERGRRRGAIGLARETFRFTRDVREGMELYKDRHPVAAGPTLGARGRQANEKTNHDPRPKDGH